MYGVFFATLWFVLGASLLSLAIAYLLPDPFWTVQDSDVRIGAGRAYRILLLSLPLVAAYTTIQFLLESMQHASLAFRIKIVHVTFQLAIVMWILHGRQMPATAADLAMGYVVADGVGLLVSFTAVMLAIDRAPFGAAAQASLRPWRQYRYYARAIQQGLPVSMGAIAQKYLFYYMGIHCAALGASVASAFSILTAIIFLLQIPIIGISHLATIKLSYAVGAHNRELISSTWAAVRKNFFWVAAVLGALGWGALSWLLMPFTSDPEVARHVIGLAYLFPLYYLVSCLFSLLLSLLRGLSDSLYPQLVVNLVLSMAVVPFLALRPDTPFFTLISIFCMAGFVAVGMVTMRWKNRYRDVRAAECT